MSKKRKPSVTRGRQRGRRIVIVHDGTEPSWAKVLELVGKFNRLYTLADLPRNQQKELMHSFCWGRAAMSRPPSTNQIHQKKEVVTSTTPKAIELLNRLVRKIDNERSRGTPLIPKGIPDCEWNESYPRELSAAREFLEGVQP
jgi:hypothetical protein